MFVLFFLLWRVGLFCVAAVAQKTVPYLGFFPYKEVLPDYGLPTWISAFANFDGLHYLFIAKQGYSQYEQAFFPLYPLLIRATSFFLRNELVSSLVVSWFAFAGGVFVFQSLLKRTVGDGVWSVLLLFLSFPYSFFFGAVYTEALFFLLMASSLYCVQRRWFLLAVVCATLTSLTRLSGVFLIFPFLFMLLPKKQRGGTPISLQTLFVAASPLFGLVSYALYLFVSTGDPLFFFTSQPAFGANRSTTIVLLPQVLFRYARIVLFADRNFQWFIALSELLFFLFALSVLAWGLWFEVKKNASKDSSFVRGLLLFSLVNILVPTLTGTLSSIGRYVVLSVGIFIVLGRLLGGGRSIALSAFFLLLQIVFLALFIQGYFVG